MKRHDELRDLRSTLNDKLEFEDLPIEKTEQIANILSKIDERVGVSNLGGCFDDRLLHEMYEEDQLDSGYSFDRGWSMEDEDNHSSMFY